MGRVYQVQVGRVGQPTIDTEATTLREARNQIEAHGSTQDMGRVYRGSRLVAEYRRDTSGDGRKWFRAEIGQ